MSCTFREDSETRPPPVRVHSALGTGQLRLWNTSFRPALFCALLSKMRLRTWTRLLLSDCSVWRMETKLVWYINPPQSPRRGLICSMALDFHAMWLKWLALSNAFMTEVRKMLRSLWLSLAHFLLLSLSYSQTLSFACWYVSLRFTLPFRILDW